MKMSGFGLIMAFPLPALHSTYVCAIVGKAV